MGKHTVPTVMMPLETEAERPSIRQQGKGTAAVFAAGVLSAGTVGGFANECAGGSYTAGFIGGSATGTIQTLGSFLGSVGNTIEGTIGSGIGTYLTERIDNG